MLSYFSIWADRLRALQGWRRYGAAFLFGAMAALAFPPFNAVAALWFFFPSLAFLLQGAVKKRQAFFLGWFFAFGLLTVSLYWIAGALFVDIETFWWLVPFAVSGLPAMFAVYHGLAALAAWRWGLHRFDGLIVLAVAWSMADYARGTLMTGFPWDLTGYVWGDVLPVLQLASVVGVYGLTLFTLVLAVLPAAMAPPFQTRKGVMAVAIGLMALAAVAGWGVWRLDQAPQVFMPEVRLRLVQPDMDQGRKWRLDEREANFQRLLDLSFVPAEKPVTHVLWPETATAYYLTEDESARKAIAARLREGQTLLTGVVQRAAKPDGSLMYFNSLIAIDSRAQVTAGYAKFHLVPFGEYVPFRSLLPFRAVAAIGDFTPGDGLQTLRVEKLPPFSPLVCYEAIFPGEVARKDEKPRFLLNVTNDAWYDRTTGPYQHFAIVRARAVEEGVPLVRVANKGINGVVDGYGRIVARQGWGKADILDSELPQVLTDPTVFSRWGNGLYLVLAGFIVAAAFVIRLATSARKPY